MIILLMGTGSLENPLISTSILSSHVEGIFIFKSVKSMHIHHFLLAFFTKIKFASQLRKFTSLMNLMLVNLSTFSTMALATLWQSFSFSIFLVDGMDPYLNDALSPLVQCLACLRVTMQKNQPSSVGRP